MTQPVFTRCIFCLLISLQSFTAWPEAVPSPPVVSLLHLQGSAFPSVPVLQSEPPFLHTPQAGNFNSVFIHFYQKTSCTQGPGFFPLSPKLSLDCDWTPEEVAQGGCGVSDLGDIQNLTGHSPEKPAFSDAALHRGLDRWSPEVPASLTHSVSGSKKPSCTVSSQVCVKTVPLAAAIALLKACCQRCSCSSGLSDSEDHKLWDFLTLNNLSFHHLFS